jgi:hypothetical protein
MIAKLLCSALLVAPAPQERTEGGPTVPVPCVVTAVPGVAARALWLALPFGPAHDPAASPGLARVLARALLDGLPAQSAERAVEVFQTPTTTFVGRVVQPDEFDAALAECARLLAGELPLDDAGLIRARDRAVLRADDETVVLPGPVLRGRAARRLLAPPDAAVAHAIPERLYALDAPALRAAFRERAAASGALCVVLGGEDEAADRARCETVLVGPARRSPLPVRSVAPEPEPAESTHELAEAVFVVAAIRAPAREAAEFWPFAVGMELLRVRAARAFHGFRGAELRAEFPMLEYDPVLAPPLAFVERRGAKADEPAAVRAEIAELLAALVERPPTAAELAAAVAKLRSEFRAPPFDERTRLGLLARQPSVLLRCGKVATLRALSGFTTAGLDAIEPASVHATLAARTAPDALEWVVLLPVARGAD